MNDLYTFIYRGVLTEESLDKAGRNSKPSFGPEDAEALRAALSLELIDDDLVTNARRMAIIYTAVHAFENSVRKFVEKALFEIHEQGWWQTAVSERIRKKVTARMEEEARFKWHGSRGGSEIEYCDFGDLSNIIVQNWTHFEDVLADIEWTKSVLSVLERSRNIVMHGGSLARQDIERIGMNIRDWTRQAG